MTIYIYILSVLQLYNIMYNVCKHVYFLNNLFTFIFKAGYRALNVYFNIIYSIIKVCFMITIVCTVNTPDSSF